MKLLWMLFIFLGGLALFCFFIPVPMYRIFNIGNAMGIIFSACMLFYGIFYGYINLLIKRIASNLFGKIFITSLLILVFIAILYVIFFTFKMIDSSSKGYDTDSTLVVLGCRVKEEGPGIMLSERINSAYEYLSRHPEAKCILSGGQGHDEPISEAESMYNHLVEKGIDPDRLYKEDKSTSTRENIAFSLALIQEKGLSEDITLITNEFHLYRAVKLSERMGINCGVYPAKTRMFLLPTYYVRELLCIFKEIVLTL